MIAKCRSASAATAICAVWALTSYAGPVIDMSWFTVDGGGGVCSNGMFELSSSIGQPDAGYMSGGEFEILSGFMIAASASQSVPGDCDGDGDVDLDDYVCFDACLSGPEGGLLIDCGTFDFDTDSDVDLLDFAEFQMQFTG